MTMPPMETGKMQFQQMSVIGSKEFDEHSDLPVTGIMRISTIVQARSRTDRMRTEDTSPFENGSEVYYFGEGEELMGGDPTFADAICDRVVHNAHKIILTGESMRKTHSGLT
jgi:hypothetical protein